MVKEETYVIGLMSGTSLDGVDIVYVNFDVNEYRNFTIIQAKTYSYSASWKEKLQTAILQSPEDLEVLNKDYGKLLGELIVGFKKEFAITNVDFIASHGHTVFHQPEKGYTLQVGDGQIIADVTKHEVICDFRTQDVALGGQGAPLVPIGDELLFGEYDYCLNLGGFANVSYQENGKRIAFDVCAVNIVLNKYAQQLGFAYDDKGVIASRGEYLLQLGAELNALPFYKKKPPKSLGLEWVKKEIFPKIESSKRASKDILKTFTLHAAHAIAKVFPKNAKVLVTGGGAFNDYLISSVLMQKKINIIIPDKKLIEFKEALIFAFLGLLKKQNKVNCLRSVTGAQKDHSSGVVFCPNN